MKKNYFLILIAGMGFIPATICAGNNSIRQNTVSVSANIPELSNPASKVLTGKSASAFFISLKSDASVSGAGIGAGCTNGDMITALDTTTMAETLTFEPVDVTDAGSWTNIPPEAPEGTAVINIKPSDGQNGYFKLTFTLPAGFQNAVLSGKANIDDRGRAFLNEHPVTGRIESDTAITQSGNVSFQTGNMNYFRSGENTILFSVANTGCGPSSGAFYVNIQYELIPTTPFSDNILQTDLAMTDSYLEILEQFDYDNDGFEDIIASITGSAVAIFKNNGNGTFTNVTSTVNFPAITVSPGTVSCPDLDNNGFPDIVCFQSYSYNYLPESLRIFMNYNGLFEEKTAAFGIVHPIMKTTNRICSGIMPFDIDRDGDIDFVFGNSLWNASTSCSNSKISALINDINTSNTFSATIDLITLPNNILPARITLTDSDNDQLQDIVVCEQSGGKAFDGYRADIFNIYKNRGNNVFVKVENSLLNYGSPHNFLTVTDYNNDGFLDFINGTSDCCGTATNIIWKNNGNNTFTDMRSQINITPVHDYYSRISTVDFNNDGFPDISTTMLGGYWSDTRHQLWQNNGTSFVNVAAANGINTGYNGGNKGIGLTAEWLDFDNDGDQDFYSYAGNDTPARQQHFMVNNNLAGNRYLRIKLYGTQSPKDGTGARVVLKSGTKTLTQYNNGVIGNSHSDIFHFGLGNAQTVDSVIVFWPGGRKSVILNAATNKLMKIYENDVPEELNNGLIAYFPFNGNANDESGYNNHGQISGATLTTDRFGNENKAYYFNGIDNYIRVNDNPEINQLTNQFSITAWIQIYQSTNDHQIIAGKWYNNGTPNPSWLMEFQPNGNIFQLPLRGISSDSYSNASSTVPVEFNKWQLLAGVYDGTGIKLYLNGNLTFNQPFAGNITLTSAPLFIGAHDSSGDRNPLYGKIDEVRIYNRALTATEIAGMYDLTTTSTANNASEIQYYITSDNLIITNLQQECLVSISDLSGKTIYKNRLKQSEKISLKKFTKGLYIVTLTTNQKRESFKLMVR